MLEARLCSPEDVDEILRIYALATELMRQKNQTAWPVFKRDFVLDHIEDKRQFKFVMDNQVACIWSVAYSDPLIWGSRDKDPSVYLHRIATNQAFSGRRFVSAIASWARQHARDRDFRYVRMDTAGENLGLIEHYQRCGFRFLGLTQLPDVSGLPEHYRNTAISLFELDALSDAGD